ncbi:hypothetical protein C2G38_2228247 [Gigaspora rosea]|uniref:Uncharacterized protein n=1 Tax=Gigaspora rosea TaxID=44941 RepID=A0A397TY11_9GLOM|nr:hypothetical protein C2G38_2228247 [Gigaspora rosea]
MSYSSSVSDKMLDVSFLNINRGLIINAREIFFSNLSAYDLESQPEISPLKSMQFQTKLKFSDVIINSTNGPLTDKSPANIYIEIQCSKFCLAIPKRIIKPTVKLIEDAKKALQHHYPYQKLMDLFQIYGHFLPKKMVLGHKIFRMTYLDKILSEYSLEINLKWKNKNFPKEDLNEIFDQFEKYISSHNLDSLFFVSINGDFVMRNDFEEWTEHCLNNDPYLLQIVSWNELYPLYEIFDQPLRQEIESVIGVSDQSNIKERVLMAGAIPISDTPFSYRVNFPTHFKFNNYQLFGKLIDQNGKPFNNVVIKFKSNDIDGDMDLIIIWILVRIPANVGFFSTDIQRIDIVGLGNTSLTITSKSDNYSILLKVPENVPQSPILVTSFKFPPTNYNLNFKIKAQNNKANEIKITVCKLGSDKVDYIYELECSIQWCILVISENLKFYNSSISVNHLKAIGEYIYPEYNIMALFDESKLNTNQKFESDTQVAGSKSLTLYSSELKREIQYNVGEFENK